MDGWEEDRAGNFAEIQRDAEWLLLPAPSSSGRGVMTQLAAQAGVFPTEEEREELTLNKRRECS